MNLTTEELTQLRQLTHQESLLHLEKTVLKERQRSQELEWMLFRERVGNRLQLDSDWTVDQKTGRVESQPTPHSNQETT